MKKKTIDSNKKEKREMFDYSKHEADFKQAEFWAVFGVIGNILLTVVKGIAGVLGGSSAMVADAVHSASDVIASGVVFISLRIAKKPADEDHPYGHGKAEAISSSIVGLLLLAAGYQILMNAYHAIAGGSHGVPTAIALYAAILSIAAKEAMFRVTYRVGVKINSPSTVANAYDHRSDAFSSIATLIGIGGAMLGFSFMDPLAGGVVALFIMRMGYSIVIDASHQMMDKSVDEEIIKKITQITQGTEGVLSTHGIRVRQSGPFYLVDLDICVNRKLSIEEAHEICDEARSNIFQKMEKIADVRIHVDPSVKD
ncbi:MAG: hypothetical protein AVO33_11370 [delta proteobacterium ML8_F1]|nr:MAG: hypothetical protein AVO33_11370 [delta proteobacterium ML8_F1]